MSIGRGRARLGAWSCFVSLLAQWLLGCGAHNAASPVHDTWEDGSLHDPVAEWAAQVPRDTPPPQAAPEEAPPRLRFDPYASEYARGSSRRAPAFGRDEAERIARVQEIVARAARTHALPTSLINGIIWVESRFHVRARSRVGACSLMQLMPRTAREVARNTGLRYDIFDPEFNIHAGTYYFSQMLSRFAGDTTLALAAYNIGPAVVAGWQRDARPLPSHSRNYVDNVLTAADAFRALEM